MSNNENFKIFLKKGILEWVRLSYRVVLLKSANFHNQYLVCLYIFRADTVPFS